VSIPTDPAAAPAQPGQAQSDEHVKHATTRNGMPGLVALGTLLAILGVVIMLYTFYVGRSSGALPRPAGMRGDYVGILLLLIGVGIAGAFLFVPRGKAYGVAADASKEAIEQEIQTSGARLRLAQSMVGVGLGLVGIGLLWMLYWVYVAYQEDRFRNSVIGPYEVPSHYFGGVLVLVGLMFMFYFWGSVAGARRRHNLAMVLLHRAPPVAAAAAAPPNVLSSGVTELEVQNLVRRLDGLMAQLPDSSVTEFSKTPEADTYLKLLGS
jgi:uncharacterized protein YjeT (DUF2065 family)